MNAKQHLVIGVGAGLIVNLLKQAIQGKLDPARPFNWAELGVYGATGGLVALIPDMLEPATHPNHRAFFHSVAFGGLAVFATHGEHTNVWDPEVRAWAQAASWGYASHLVADATTPMGIGII